MSPIKVDQVWGDCDPRAGNRLIKVLRITKTHAICLVLNSNVKTKIRLDRMRPFNRGYKPMKFKKGVGWIRDFDFKFGLRR